MKSREIAKRKPFEIFSNDVINFLSKLSKKLIKNRKSLKTSETLEVLVFGYEKQI